MLYMLLLLVAVLGSVSAVRPGRKSKKHALSFDKLHLYFVAYKLLRWSLYSDVKA